MLNAPKNGASVVGASKHELSTGWLQTNHSHADSDPLRSSRVLSINDEAQIRPNSGKSTKPRAFHPNESRNCRFGPASFRSRSKG
jgi:hypothetical protein